MGIARGGEDVGSHRCLLARGQEAVDKRPGRSGSKPEHFWRVGEVSLAFDD